MQPISASPEELLSIVSDLYPQQYDRAVAELTIRKQADRIKELEEQLVDAVDDAARAGHTHGE